MNIEQKILDYKSQLDYFDDVMDKYKLLLNLSCIFLIILFLLFALNFTYLSPNL